MFEHLFQGSPPWLLAAALLGVIVHVSAGGLAIFSGAAALSFRKGERLHRAFGKVFVAAMLVMAFMGMSLAAMLVLRGHMGQSGNVFAGVFAFYLVATGWMTVRRPAGTVGRFEVGGIFVALGVATVALFLLTPMTLSPAGQKSGVPVAVPIVVAGVTALAAALDLSVVRRGGVTGVRRIARHVWRMCAGLFIATGSFFLGQQKVMPVFMHGSPVLVLLAVAPLLAMVFWLVRIRRGGGLNVAAAQSLMRLHGTDASAESGSTLLNLEQIIPVRTSPSERGLL